MTSKVETLEALTQGTLTVSEAAARLNLTEADVAQWRELYAMSCEVAARTERAKRRRARTTMARVAVSATALLAIAVGVVGSQPAWAQSTCAQTLPAPMVTFCPDSPATASSVNGNLQQLVTWMQQKVGTVGSANVTVTGTLTGAAITGTTLNASTSITAPRAFVNGPIVRGTNSPATNDLGLYSQDANYMRFVTANGPFFFFTDGSAGNNYTGANAVMGLDPSGNLNVTGGFTANGQLAGASLRQRNCAWGPADRACWKTARTTRSSAPWASTWRAGNARPTGTSMATVPRGAARRDALTWTSERCGASGLRATCFPARTGGLVIARSARREP